MSHIVPQTIVPYPSPSSTCIDNSRSKFCWTLCWEGGGGGQGVPGGVSGLPCPHPRWKLSEGGNQPANQNATLTATHGGSDPSVLDANYPPPTNCWPEAPWGGGGGSLEGGFWEGCRGDRRGGRFPGGGGVSGTSEQLGMRPRCDPTVPNPNSRGHATKRGLRVPNPNSRGHATKRGLRVPNPNSRGHATKRGLRVPNPNPRGHATKRGLRVPNPNSRGHATKRGLRVPNPNFATNDICIAPRLAISGAPSPEYLKVWVSSTARRPNSCTALRAPP